MTADEAAAEAGRLNREHPDRARFHWIARGGQVMRVPKPHATNDPFKATIEAKPKPQQPEDPRSSYDHNIGGP